MRSYKWRFGQIFCCGGSKFHHRVHHAKRHGPDLQVHRGNHTRLIHLQPLSSPQSPMYLKAVAVDKPGAALLVNFRVGVCQGAVHALAPKAVTHQYSYADNSLQAPAKQGKALQGKKIHLFKLLLNKQNGLKGRSTEMSVACPGSLVRASTQLSCLLAPYPVH